MALARAEELRKLKRSELQALAKTHSIKANLKTDVLIEALEQLAETTPPVTELQSVEASTSQSRPTPAQNAKLQYLPHGHDCVREDKALRSQVDSLIETIATLQSELKVSSQTIADLREELHCQRRDSLTVDAVRDLVRAEVEKQSQNLARDLASENERIRAGLDERVGRVNAELKEQAQRLHRLETSTTGFASQLGSPEERVGALGQSDPVGPADLLAEAVTSTEEDAPPTQTLISFSSPAISHTGETSITGRPSTLARGETPITPGRLALPAHMLAVSSVSAPRRNPRAALAAAQPAPRVSLSARASDGNEIANAGAAQVETQRSAAQQTPDVSRSGFYTAPSTVTRPTSAQHDSHIRKRLRTSIGGTSQAAVGNESIAVYEDEDEDEDDNEDSRSREYTVRTKTGSSPAVIMTRDPSFFASRPVSPSARPAALASRSRASSISGRGGATPDRTNNDEGATSGGRKSMPMSSLPFPLVSPYRNTGRTSAQPPAVPFGAASSTPRTIKTGFGNFFSGLDSANKTDAGRRLSMFSSANKAALLGSVRKGPPPPTPPAQRTLFGTEFTGNRFGDAATDIDDDPENNSDSLRWGAFAA